MFLVHKKLGRLLVLQVLLISPILLIFRKPRLLFYVCPMTVDFIQHVLAPVMDRLQSVKKSQLVRPFQPTFAKYNPLELLNVVDCGDADTTPSIIEDSFKEIEAAVH